MTSNHPSFSPTIIVSESIIENDLAADLASSVFTNLNPFYTSKTEILPFQSPVKI